MCSLGFQHALLKYTEPPQQENFCQSSLCNDTTAVTGTRVDVRAIDLPLPASTAQATLRSLRRHSPPPLPACWHVRVPAHSSDSRRATLVEQTGKEALSRRLESVDIAVFFTMTAFTGHQTDSFQTARVAAAKRAREPPKSPSTAPKTCGRNTTSKPNDRQTPPINQGAVQAAGRHAASMTDEDNRSDTHKPLMLRTVFRRAAWTTDVSWYAGVANKILTRRGPRQPTPRHRFFRKRKTRAQQCRKYHYYRDECVWWRLQGTQTETARRHPNLCLEGSILPSIRRQIDPAVQP